MGRPCDQVELEERPLPNVIFGAAARDKLRAKGWQILAAAYVGAQREDKSVSSLYWISLRCLSPAAQTQDANMLLRECSGSIELNVL